MGSSKKHKRRRDDTEEANEETGEAVSKQDPSDVDDDFGMMLLDAENGFGGLVEVDDADADGGGDAHGHSSEKKKKKSHRHKHKHRHRHHKRKKEKKSKESKEHSSSSRHRKRDHSPDVGILMPEDGHRSRHLDDSELMGSDRKRIRLSFDKRDRGSQGAMESSRTGGSGGGGEISLSIEETNKLRAKLGLKPLEVNEDKPKKRPGGEIAGSGSVADTGTVVTVDGETFVHKRPGNLQDKKRTEEMREKLATQRHKRQIQEQLSRLRTLGESEDDEDSALAWVHRSRRIEDEQRKAQERERLLTEMDAEFGVNDLIEKEITGKSEPVEATHTATDLAGMKVEHSKENFMEGKDIVLVLKDQDVLAEGEEEILMNPTLETHQQWMKNAEMRKRKPGYNPYEEEVDPTTGTVKKASLLSKYDEELDPKAKDSFRLDSTGGTDTAEEIRRKIAIEQLKRGAVSLEMPELKITSEYMTPEEMIKFKKPKKVRKVRKRGILRADDLLEATGSNATAASGADLGSRRNRIAGSRASIPQNFSSPVNAPNEVTVKMEQNGILDPAKPELDDDDDDDIYAAPLEDDDAGNELETALARTRRLRAQNRPAGHQAFHRLPPHAAVVKEEKPDDQDDDERDIVLDSMSEYCRGVGDIPTFGMAGNRDEEELAAEQRSDSEDDAQDAMSVDSDDESIHDGEPGTSNSWVKATFDTPEASDDEMQGGSAGATGADEVLEEPDCGSGLAGALEYSKQKGYFDAKKKKNCGVVTGNMKHMEAARYSVVDKQFDDIDSKYARKLERLGGGGPLVEFREKPGYKPDFRLEYADESGRLMNEKEAFQFLSWKFHGKKPGKQKLEKNMKKVRQEELMQQMSITDTPLGTASKQRAKQEQLQMHYIPLSGASAKEGFSQIRKD